MSTTVHQTKSYLCLPDSNNLFILLAKYREVHIALGVRLEVDDQRVRIGHCAVDIVIE